MTIESIAIIGSGRIGRGWAIVFARAGFNVNVHDANSEMLAGAVSAIRDSVEDLNGFGLIDEPVETIVARVKACPDLAEAVRDVVLVQENIGEVVEAKRALFAELDRLTRPDTLLASSTSGLPASTFTEGLTGRARCLVGHPVNPPSLVPLVELCGAPWTSPATLGECARDVRAAGQKPVTRQLRDLGLPVQSFQGALLDEAMSLYAQGYASAADLDTVMRTDSPCAGLSWARSKRST